MKEKTFCLIQLTRMGDLVQTAQAARSLRELHPDLRLILIARSDFSRPLSFILKGVFDRIIELDGKDLLNQVGLTKAIFSFSHFLSQVHEESIDICFNFSYSPLSQYLSSLVPTRYRFGPYRDMNNQIAIDDLFGRYVFSSVLTGAYNPFSLVDLYRKSMGPSDISWMSQKGEHSQEKRKLSDKRTIILHPFASSERKCWPLAYWKELIYYLLKEHKKSQLILIGSKDESDSARSLLESTLLTPFQERIFNYVGEKSLEELPPLFENASLFIGHDSLGGHLASYYDVQTLTLCLGPVRPHETIPYRDLNYALAPVLDCSPCRPHTPCEDYPCRDQLPVQAVIEAAHQLLEFGGIRAEILEKKISPAQRKMFTLYEARVSQETGLSLIPLFGQMLGLKELFFTTYNVFWSYLLFSEERVTSWPQFDQNHLDFLERYLQGIQAVYELYEFGITYSRQLLRQGVELEERKESTLSTLHKIEEVQSMAIKLMDSFPYLTPVISFNDLNLKGAQGDGLTDFLYHLECSFKESADTAKIIFDLLNQVKERAIDQESNQKHQGERSGEH